MLWIRIRIFMFFGPLDPDPDPFIDKQNKYGKILISAVFCDFLFTFYF